KRLPKSAVGVIASGAAFISFIFAAGAVFQLLQLEPAHRVHMVRLYEWINAGPLRIGDGSVGRFSVDWSCLLASLSCVMVLVVTAIAFLIRVYSTGYMHEEDGFYPFFAYLTLFMFSMLTLLLSRNYLTMFIRSEALGLCSYLLTGYPPNTTTAG